MNFATTAINVLLLVAMAIPGFILMKVKLVKPTAMAFFSVVLLYVSQPFLSLQSFLKVQYSRDMLVNIGIVFGFSILAQGLIFCVLWFVLNRKFDNPEITSHLQDEGLLDGGVFTTDEGLKLQIANTKRGRAYRVMVCVSTFGNVGFFGVPILQFLFPDHPETVVYSAIMIVTMNVMCWSVGAYVLTGDRKYMSVKKALINPPVLTLVVALPLYFSGVTLNDLPDVVVTVIGYLANMTTPLCMIVLGMRFAVAPMHELFTDWKIYVSTLIKTLIFPLLVFAVLYPFDLDPMLFATLVILCGMPSASVNLNLAELYGADQKTAANSILLSTLFSILTIPVLMMLVSIKL